MKTANDITKAYNEAYRKDNDLIFFLLGGTVSNFLEEQYKKAKEGYQTFPYEMSYEAFEEKFLDPQIARKIFQRADSMLPSSSLLQLVTCFGKSPE